MTLVTAAIVAIGDELLSGRTRDANIHYLAGWLTERGVRLEEVRIIPDDHQTIVSAINGLRGKHSYVFTSGGIGPTHDDITFEAVAACFGVALKEHPGARAMLDSWYAAKNLPVTPERARMAMMPDGARLIQNSQSGAPGIIIDNVFVMAGVPRIFQAMTGAIEEEIKGGAMLYSKAVTARGLAESALARQLVDIQAALKGVTLGSYPIDVPASDPDGKSRNAGDGDIGGVTIVARSEHEALAQTAIDSVVAAMRALGFEPEFGDRR